MLPQKRKREEAAQEESEVSLNKSRSELIKDLCKAEHSIIVLTNRVKAIKKELKKREIEEENNDLKELLRKKDLELEQMKTNNMD